ncbi:hydrogenase maturation nickel metallochaperone HypA [uncultured Roseibium sp.]|uniref:hydrogenase maturation nickel metallochaperone HypA n=1 Tax=uncultured Roseibium sp. TaxID=1936171 RepID=UPI00261B9787|nr:hydrogenase maturation nickel metallochaperone HypA [uncultured Roseibium sp.]
MHEMSLCENILEIITDQADQQAFSKVDLVRLEVGPLSGVEVEALRFGFDVVMRGSVAEDARLDILCPEATAWCQACETNVPILERYDPCPNCGAVSLQITSGGELRIKEMEVS